MPREPQQRTGERSGNSFASTACRWTENEGKQSVLALLLQTRGAKAVSVHFSTLEELDEVLSPMDFQRLPLPYEAGFLAAKCFLAYRRRGGQKHAPFPDFYIGAHAATERLALLTCDVARYRTYYPSVQLIIPGREA
jgi:predicted nucleic acid-binding protein